MDLLAVLGGERKEVGPGLFVHPVSAGCYLAALSAKSSTEDRNESNMRFSAAMLAGALRDESGALVLTSIEEALGLPLQFFLDASSAALALSSIDEKDADEDLAGK